MDYISFCNYGENDEFVHEPHIMPTPSGSPWNIRGLSWGSRSPPQLVQFNADVTTQPKFTTVMHCKRKSLEPEPRIPAKIHITEDKMAAHLSGLHLSTDYTTHHLALDSQMDVNMEPTPANDMRDKLKGHTIVLSEELKKLKEEPLLPPSLMDRLEKPCMSLVVWQPKESIVKTSTDNKENTEEEEVKRRPGVLVPDMGMDVEMMC